MSKMYFDQRVQNAIVQYNESDDFNYKNKLFEQEVYPAFDKLAEITINVYKMPYINQQYQQIKQDILGHLVIKMPYYNREKGRAFSYFSTIAK